jgi:hypothetical protein
MSLVQDKPLLLIHNREYTMTSLHPINVLHKTTPLLPTVPTTVPNPLQITTLVQNHNHPRIDYPPRTKTHTPCLHNPTVPTPLQTAVSSPNVPTTAPTPCPPHPSPPPTTAPTVSQPNVPSIDPTAGLIPSPPRQTEPTLPLELLPNPRTAVPSRAKTDEACRLPHLTDEGVAVSLAVGVPKWISQDPSNLVNKSPLEVQEEHPPPLPLRPPVPVSREYEKKVQNTVPLLP